MTERVKFMLRKSLSFKRVRIHISALIIPLFFFVGGDAAMFGMLIISVALHELAHIAAIRASGLYIETIEVTALGLAIVKKGSSSYKRDIIIASWGPIASFAAFVISYLIYMYVFPSYVLSIFCALNLIIFVLNIIPVLPLDGGVILWSYLLSRLDIQSTKRTFFMISLFTACGLFALGCVVLWHTRYNISLMIISLFLIFSVAQYEKIM